MGNVDLHTHTTCSDGTYSPSELVALASSKGLQAVAITDHDTIAGLSEARKTGESLDIEVITGAELSIDYDLPESGHMHLLGLFLDPASHELREGLDWLRRKREERTPKIIRKLEEHGVHITGEEIMAKAGGGAVGRPHMARLMIEKGYVSSIQEAFDLYLKKGAVAYMPREKFHLTKAIHLIRSANGLPILAHPYSLKLGESKLEELLITMKEMGMAGIEAYYSNHSPEQTQLYLSLAERLDLVVSGGTDFHGDNKPEIKLGSGFGDLNVPYTVVQGLKERRTRGH